MTIPYTSVHAQRITNQCTTLLMNMQRDLTRNAAAHKAMAVAQSAPLVTLQKFFTDTAASYQKLLNYLNTYQSQNPVNFPAALSANGIVATDITALVNAFTTIVTNMQAADLSSYASISAACDAITAQVAAPPSLWPE